MAPSFDPAQVAFESAIRDFKASLDDEKLYKSILGSKSINDVYDATDKLQQEQAKTGHLRHLSKIEPYLKNLQEYSASIEVFVQVKPDIMALIWGPIKLLLQWASVLKTSFDAIVNTVAEIGTLLPEFTRVIGIFGENKHMNDVLALFFKDILEFYAIALRFFKLPRWKYLFESLWPRYRERIKLVMTHIEGHVRLMRNEVQLEHIQREHEARLRQLEHFEKMERDNLRGEYERIKTGISPKSFDDTFYRLSGQTYEGTGKWLLEDAAFTKWLDISDSSSRVLWLQGIPGAGKTFLSGTVAAQAQHYGRTAFAFLSHTLSSSTTAISVIHSIIFQLVSNDLDLQTVICESSRETLQRDICDARDLLSKVIACAGASYVIIDGLDEISGSERGRLLDHILNISKTCDDTKILISSRPESDIDAKLANEATIIRIDRRNTGSIEAFVTQWVQKWFLDREFLPETQTEILEHLASLAFNSKGMFLYAKVVLSIIEYMDDITEICNELVVLPESLDDAYRRILERVNTPKHPSLKEKARKILGWIACSPKPLTVQEIQQALTIIPNDKEGKARVIGNLLLVKICGPILEIVDDYVQFVHFTVKEYILSPRIPGSIDTTEATLSLAIRCITYLFQQHHNPNLTEEEIRGNVLSGVYVLHNYATTTWLELVERYVGLNRPQTLLSDLVDSIMTFRGERDNQGFEEATDSASWPNLVALRDAQPEVYKFLVQASQFRLICSASEHRMQQGALWIDLDPTTTSQISVRIHKIINSLLLDVQEEDKASHYMKIQKWYGRRPFKCRFLHCPDHRQGFETEKERESHEKNHDRPWKCSVPGCEYAEGGFLSRKMRDAHLDRFHRDQGKQNHNYSTSDDDEVQSLLLDLVKANKIDAVRTLLPEFDKLGSDAQFNIIGAAAFSGSSAMVGLLIYPLEDEYLQTVKVMGIAIRGNNLEVLELFLQHKELDIGYNHMVDVFPLVVASESIEIRAWWKKWASIIIKSENRKYTKGQLANFGCLKVKPILSTASIPQREQFLLDHWNKFDLLYLGGEFLGNALAAVASTTQSIRLAEYLIRHGANIEYQRNESYPTPLQYAARVDSAQGAELMKFLLLHGANPQTATNGVKIVDEIGVKGISRWLNMTWDELVEQTARERDRMKSGSSAT
ncbi:NACHT domain protein [Hypomontagnella monticulosa]|nr:NACHT domain protein [Hypomontagnella monticulosa]